MNIKDVIGDNTKDSILAFKKEYYLSVYKKTEKIVSAVFVITDNCEKKDEEAGMVKDTRVVAKESLMYVVDLMSGGSIRFEDVVRAFLTLRSFLFVLGSAQMIRGELVTVVTREIDGVMANLVQMQREKKGGLSLETDEQPPFMETAVAPRKLVHTPSLPPSVRVPREAGENSGSASAGRRERILEVVRTRGVVSIKDISDTITDCSEKTIQRDLIDMIKDNILQKEGERRWSKYRLT